MGLWWLLAAPILPFFYVSGLQAKWRKPTDPVLVVKILILQFYLPAIDVLTDFWTGASFFLSCHVLFGWYTISVTFLPFFGKLLSEITQIIRIKRKQRNLFNTMWKFLIRDKLKQVLVQLPFIQPGVTLSQIRQLSQLSAEDVEAEKILFRMASDRVWEPFLEAGPQLTLQLLIVWQTGEVTSIQCVTMPVSCFALCWAGASTFFNNRVDHGIASPSVISNLIVTAIVSLLVIPRILYFSIMAYLSGYWVGITIVSTIAVVRIALKFFSVKEPKPTMKYNGDKDEYFEVPCKGFKPIMDEIRLKSTFLSVFAPTVVGFKRSKILLVSSVASITALLCSLGSLWLYLSFGSWGHANSPTFQSLSCSTEKPCLRCPLNETDVLRCSKASWPTENNMSYQILQYSVQCGIKICKRRCSDNGEPYDNLVFGWFPALFCLMVLSAGSSLFLEKMTDFIRLEKWIPLKHKILLSLAILLEEEREAANEASKKKDWILWRNYINDEGNESELCRYVKRQKIDQAIIIGQRKGFSRIIFVTATVTKMISSLRYQSRHIEALNSCKVGVSTKNEHCHNYGDEKSENEQQFLEASRDGDVIQVYKLLKRDVNIDVKCTDTGNTALMFAAEKGNEAITELLLMEQASVFLVNNNNNNSNIGLSALTLAHQRGHAVIVNMICTRLAEDKELDAHMLHASEEGDLATVLALLSFDPNLFSVVDKMHGKSSLHLAAEKDHSSEVASFLCVMMRLKPEAIMKKNNYGQNYIHSACLGGSLYLLRLLLPLIEKMNRDAIVETDASGRTALWFAARKGHLEIVQELLPIFSSIDPQSIIARKTDGSNALMAAAFFGHTETVRELLPRFKNIDPSSLFETYHDCEDAGENLISIAELKGHVETKQLIEDFMKSNNLPHPNAGLTINRNYLVDINQVHLRMETCV